MNKKQRKRRNRLIALGVVLLIALLVFLGYRFVINHLLIPSDKVIECGQKSVWSNEINASELQYTVENEYCKTVSIDGGDVHGYCLPTGEYGIVSFGTANIYIYEELVFDGEPGYYQTWIINFYSGNEVIQKNTYTSPTEFTSDYVKDYIQIGQENNLVIVNGSAQFYMDPEQ